MISTEGLKDHEVTVIVIGIELGIMRVCVLRNCVCCTLVLPSVIPKLCPCLCL